MQTQISTLESELPTCLHSGTMRWEIQGHNIQQAYSGPKRCKNKNRSEKP